MYSYPNAAYYGQAAHGPAGAYPGMPHHPMHAMHHPYGHHPHHPYAAMSMHPAHRLYPGGHPPHPMMAMGGYGNPYYQGYDQQQAAGMYEEHDNQSSYSDSKADEKSDMQSSPQSDLQ